MAQPIYGCLLFLSVACGTFSEAKGAEEEVPGGKKASVSMDGFFISCLSLIHAGQLLRGGHMSRIDLRSLILILRHSVLVTNIDESALHLRTTKWHCTCVHACDV